MTETRTPQDALTVADINVRQVVKNILSTYAKATELNKIEGSSWYPNTLQIAYEMSHAYGVSVEHAVTVIAHTSPRIHFVKNIHVSHLILSGKPTPGYISTFMNMARNSLTVEDPLSTLNGKKVKSFAANILGDTNAVTVDVWAMRVAFGNKGFNIKWLERKGFYEAIAHCYRVAAKRLGITPRELQAICWCVARNGRSR